MERYLIKIILDGSAILHSFFHLNFTRTHKPTVGSQGRYDRFHFTDEQTDPVRLGDFVKMAKLKRARMAGCAWGGLRQVSSHTFP